MIHRRALLRMLAATPALTLGGRAHAETGDSADSTGAIVATTGMIADAARALTGLGVTGLMGPGIDPHGYRPTRSDVALMARAKVILWHGLGLEAQLAPLLSDLAARKPVLAVAEVIDGAARMYPAGFSGRPDPHVWMDPALWAQVVAQMAPALGRAGFDADPAPYLDQIAATGAYAAEVLATVPPGRRVLVTAHDAFGYFGRAFGFEVAGIQGISTESEAGLARIADLVDMIVERGIGAIFVESSVSDRTIRALAEGAAARGHEVVIGGELFSDAMGPEGSYEGTWPGMMDHNVTTIARALGGTAPAGGRIGQLAGG